MINMTENRKGQRGFTLIEILIVLAVLAVLAAIVVPNVSGFLGRGKARSFESDQRILQAAVDAWRTDIESRKGGKWPTVSEGKGALADADTDGVDIGTDSTVLDIAELSSDGYIAGTDVVRSFAYSAGTETGATNTPIGSYIWYVNSSGRVTGVQWEDDANSDDVIDLGEKNSTEGFITDVYP